LRLATAIGNCTYDDESAFTHLLLQGAKISLGQLNNCDEATNQSIQEIAKALVLL
jgi:hypothetical protein